MLYSGVLVSALQQSESAIHIHMSPHLLPLAVSLPPSLSHPSRWSQSTVATLFFWSYQPALNCFPPKSRLFLKVPSGLSFPHTLFPIKSFPLGRVLCPDDVPLHLGKISEPLFQNWGQAVSHCPWRTPQFYSKVLSWGGRVWSSKLASPDIKLLPFE